MISLSLQGIHAFFVAVYMLYVNLCADGDFCLVEDTAVPYGQLVQEIMAIPGVLSVGLMEDVATHVVISGRSADAKLAVFSKDELQEAARAAEAQIKEELEKGEGA